VSINVSPNGVHGRAAGHITDHAIEDTADITAALTAAEAEAPPPPGARAAVDIPLGAEPLWSVVSDLNHLDRWLTIHDAWNSDVPIEVITGAELVEQVTLTGWTGAVSWTVQACKPPNLLRLTGTGLREARVSLELTIEPIGYWSRVIAEMEFTGWAAAGAAGVVLELGATRELETSLLNLERLVTG
jgi:polyketide cyclase/dehydrase/lipid transport protein